VITWGDFVTSEGELAAFGARCLCALPAYLATVRRSGAPRVHPVTPVITTDGLYVFMEPTSPKATDLRERHWYALHSGVPDSEGTGGEFMVTGHGGPVDDAAIRAFAVDMASYDPAERYVLFELLVAEARCEGYGDVSLPAHRRWKQGP
jgi:hypothetical protein